MYFFNFISLASSVERQELLNSGLNYPHAPFFRSNRAFVALFLLSTLHHSLLLASLVEYIVSSSQMNLKFTFCSKLVHFLGTVYVSQIKASFRGQG